VHHPLQQGLRRSTSSPSPNEESVRVHHPLQQGLRPIKTGFVKIFFHKVRVHHPLQQGLRQPESLAFKAFGSCASASSITTRIKTVAIFIVSIYILL